MRPRTALTIAGSDPSGGAGIQADLKTFLAQNVYGMAVVGTLTAQNTRGVLARFDLPAEFVVAQLEAIWDDLPVDAVKIGMLGSRAVVSAVAAFLRDRRQRPPIVVDPVLVSSSGTALLDADALDALRHELIPLATLVTPNVAEAAVLGGIDVPVLITGGHRVGPEVVDVLTLSDRIVEFRHPRIGGIDPHGTGCTLSAAIAARLASGDDLETACRGAIDYVSDLIAHAPRGLGLGRPPLFHRVRNR